MKQPPQKTILLAAGGTGGHLFPAEALAQELLTKGCRVVLVTDQKGAGFRSGDKVETVRVQSATPGPGLFSKIKAACAIMAGTVQGLFLMYKYKPDAVVGFGGYPSFPTVLAAQLAGRPTLLHEQNAVLGKANRFLAARADQIAVSLPGTTGLGPKNQSKTIITGNPVRAEIRALRDTAYPTGNANAALSIFIMGGSQGAKVLSHVVPEALAQLPNALKSRVSVTQQCRPEDIEQAAKTYASAGIKAELKSFFNDVSKRLAQCHLFIGRSGASTVSEIAVAGRPAIFVPYPGHADQQQKVNAQALEKAGGAWVMTEDVFKAEALKSKIESFLTDPGQLDRAAAAARSCGQPEAALNLAMAALELTSKSKKKPEVKKHEAPAL